MTPAYSRCFQALQRRVSTDCKSESVDIDSGKLILQEHARAELRNGLKTQSSSECNGWQLGVVVA